MLGLIQYIMCSFFTLNSLLVLCSILVQSKLEYASVIWNSITSTHSTELERIQTKFAALCYTRFFNSVRNFKYEDILLALHFVCMRVHVHAWETSIFDLLYDASAYYPEHLAVDELLKGSVNFKQSP